MALHKVVILASFVVLQFVSVTASSLLSSYSSSSSMLSGGSDFHGYPTPDEIVQRFDSSCLIEKEGGKCKVTFNLGDGYSCTSHGVERWFAEVHLETRSVRLLVQPKRSVDFHKVTCDKRVPKNCDLETNHSDDGPVVSCTEPGSFAMVVGGDVAVSHTFIDGKPLSTRTATEKKCELSTLSTGEGQVTFSVDQQLSIKGAIGSVDDKAIKLFVPTTTTVPKVYEEFYCGNYKEISSKFDLNPQYPKVFKEKLQAGSVSYSMKVSMPPPYKMRQELVECQLVSKGRRCQALFKFPREHTTPVGSASMRSMHGYVDPDRRMIGLFSNAKMNTCSNYPEFRQKCDLKKIPYAKVEYRKAVEAYVIYLGLSLSAVFSLEEPRTEKYVRSQSSSSSYSSDSAPSPGLSSVPQTSCFVLSYLEPILECRLFYIIEHNGENLAVGAVEASGHVDVEKKRIQLFVQTDERTYSFTCRLRSWRKFAEKCDLKTGTLESRIHDGKGPAWLELSETKEHRLISNSIVECLLGQVNGNCQTSFNGNVETNLQHSKEIFRHVDPVKKKIHLLVRSGVGLRAYTCHDDFYKSFDLRCELETWNKMSHAISGNCAEIAKEKPINWKFVRDGEDCKAHFDVQSRWIPESAKAQVYWPPKKIVLTVVPGLESPPVKFIYTDIPKECHLENPKPKVESGFVEGTAVPTVRWSMTLGTWAIQKDCELVINRDTGVCTAHIQFDESLKPKAVSGSVDEEKELIKWSAITGGSEDSHVLYICKDPVEVDEQCTLKTQLPGILSMKQLTKGHTSYSMIVGMAGLSHSAVKTTEIDCRLLKVNECEVEMVLKHKQTYLKGEVQYAYACGNSKTEHKVLTRKPSQKDVRGLIVHNGIAVFPSPTFAFVCKSGKKWSPKSVYKHLRACSMKKNDNAAVNVIERGKDVVFQITVGNRMI